MEFEKKVSPSVIDETLWNESESQVSVKTELEVSSVLSYFEEQRDPEGKIKKKSKEEYQYLLKIYWPFYLIPLGEEETVLGIDGMALTPYQIFKNLTINDDQINNELKSLEDDALIQGLQNLQSSYQYLGDKENVNGILPPEFTKVLIESCNFSQPEGYMGISLTPTLDESLATEIFQKVNNYANTITELKNSMDKKNQMIEQVIARKNSTITEEIKTLEGEYDKKIQDLAPIIEESKKTINAEREKEINHLKEERNMEITQTMNLIKESFKPIEGKVALLNDLWGKDKNTVLNTSESDKLLTEIKESIDRFKTRIKEFDNELTNINMEIKKIAERFTQIGQKYDKEENIVNSKHDKQIQEEEAKIASLESEKASKVQARKDVMDDLEKGKDHLYQLTASFNTQLDDSLTKLKDLIATNVALSKPIKLEVPIWMVKFLHSKGNTRYVVLPPVFLPRILPKKIIDDGLSQNEIPVKIYNELFIPHLKQMFQTFLEKDTKPKRQMEEDIGEKDFLKIKQVRNAFIDGIEMLLGRQLISTKSKEIIQANVLEAFKASE